MSPPHSTPIPMSSAPVRWRARRSGASWPSTGWQPVHGISPYGPVLTHLERSIVATGADVRVQILLFKIITGLATLASAGLIWVLLGRLRPDDQLLGTTAFLWNPLIIWELSGEGHNDAVMILFILGALLLLVQGRQLAGVVVVCLAVLTKYLPAILVPLCAAYCYHTSRAARRLLLRTTIGLAVGATVGVVLFRPFWIGMDTFNGVRVNGAPGSTGSTPTMILEVLERFAPHVRWEGAIWGGVTLALVISIVGLAATVTGAASLLRATAVLWLLHTLLMSPTYWPWYAATVVAAMALTPDRSFLVMGLVVSFAARLAAPLVMVFVHGVITRRVFLGSVWVLGVGLPLLALSLYAWQPLRRRWFRRTA